MDTEKKCLKCSMPASDGTLYVRRDTELWCARCMRTALDEAESIVRDLAAQPDPMTIRLSGHCWHCDRVGKHAESCPYRRGVEYKAT
jgi:polyferredoxin